MPAFHYSAFNKAGRTLKGVLEGDSPKQVRQKLRDEGLIPTHVELVSEKNSSQRGLLAYKKSIPISALALLTRQLATLFGAGLPVEEVLLTVTEQSETPALKRVLSGVRARVLEGYSLAESLNEFPQAFPPLYRATIAAGEHSGHLDRILNRLADYVEKQQAMRQKIRQAMIYPLLMTSVATMIVIFLLTFVVPQIIGAFSETNQTIPLLTQILLALSEGTQSYGLYVLLLIALIGLLWKRALRKPAVRYRAHQWLLAIPFIGRTLIVINSARFLRTFGILFAASVPVLEAMRVSAQLITLLPMRAAVEIAILRISEGTSIHQALKQTRFFTPMSLHLIASGENSGELEAMLQKVADNQDHDVSLFIDNVLALFEPLLILLMGCVVLFIVLAVLLPIFQLDTLSGQGL